MRLAALALLSLLIAAGAAHTAVPADVLYGTTTFNILTIDSTDGTITNLEQQDEFAFRGLTFDSSGRLFASACALVPVPFGFVDCASAPSNPFFRPYDRLVELDPVTGAVLEVIGPMTDGTGLPLDMAVLASPPGSSALLGMDLVSHVGPLRFSRLWAIDPDTAQATLVTDRVPAGCEGLDCSRSAGFDGHPDGSLIHVAATGPPLPFMFTLVTLDPETGAGLTSMEILGFGPIAVRSDGTIFTAMPTAISGGVQANRLATIDPQTGSLVDVGTSASGLVIDLAFSPLVVASVAIDVQPRGPLDWINLRSRLPVAVALFGSDSVDVRKVDKETLDFEGAAPRRFSAILDVDRDDHDDLVVRFRASETTLVRGRRQEVCLTGAFDDGQPFEGCDIVDVVSFPACGLGFELALVLPLLMAMRRGSRRRPARMARR